MTDPNRPASPLRPSPLRLLGELFRRLRLPWGGRRPDLGPVREPEPQPAPEPGQESGDLDDQIRRAQIRVIREAFGKDGVGTAPDDGVEGPEDDARVAYLYRPGHALVRDSELDRVVRFFQEREERFAGPVAPVDSDNRHPVRGLTLVALPRRLDDGDDVLATLEELDAELGEGVLTPDHLLYVTATGKFCPAIEPEVPETRRPWPPIAADASAGSRARVAVVDTGLWLPAVTSGVSPWMQGVAADAADQESVDPAAIHPYAGHGTFVAGVVRCLAPGSYVEVEGALPHGGAVYESEIIAQLDQALDDDHRPQIISISAGTHTRRNIALLSFEMLAAHRGLDDGEQTIVVAAAGNDGNSDPFWPAAFPWVTAVGSVDEDGTVSAFSNYGAWVDVYARGRDVVNAFPVGSYTCYEPPHVGEVRAFKGLARWSGTSFATPIVSGLVAAEMTAAGTDAGPAVAAVIGAGTAGTDPAGDPITIVGPLS